VNLNSKYTQDKKEHHCILYDDSSGKKISVVGTYGNFGYFEGKDIRARELTSQKLSCSSPV